MSDLTLLDAIDTALSRVRERIAAAIVAGDDLEAGRIIREAVNARLADWRELERPSEHSDEVLSEAFRAVYAANAEAERRANASWTMALAQMERRDDAREVWAEMTADMRAHEAGE